MNKSLLRLAILCLMMPLPPSVIAGDAPPFLDPNAAKPPAAERRPKTVGLHGDRIEDPYFWLREKSTPAVLDYLKAENAYTAAVMEPFKPFEDALYRELLGRIKQTDVSAPYRQRGYWLYQRTEEGKQYPLLCRKKGTLDAPEEVVLDVNRLAEGQNFMALGVFEYSDDNTLLAYSTDVTGHRDYDFHLKNLTTGAEIKTPIGKLADLAWAADNRTIFYVVEDDAKRPYQLWRYTLGEQAPALLYEEKDELFAVAVDRSRDGKFLFAASASKRTSEFRFLPADQPKGEFQLIAPRRDDIQYYPEHRGGLFYLRTNDGAKEFRVVIVPVATPGPEHWQEFIPMRPGVKIEDFEPYAKFAVVIEREAGLPRFRVLDFGTKDSRCIPLSEPAYEAGSDHNAVPPARARGARAGQQSTAASDVG